MQRTLRCHNSTTKQIRASERNADVYFFNLQIDFLATNVQYSGSRTPTPGVTTRALLKREATRTSSEELGLVRMRVRRVPAPPPTPTCARAATPPLFAVTRPFRWIYFKI
ncbi:hypothetical protein EVAR_99792_1 [Eumeta japonica]|uniref:Uncharacterized protein n=1 Tax=Eumeta variegata TaxID=151549 RepID=A0A4C1ZD55_EUMVA|nr:hypothetical protein EVAR_99792_1 [Eumeta japonica]